MWYWTIGIWVAVLVCKVIQHHCSGLVAERERGKKIRAQ